MLSRRERLQELKEIVVVQVILSLLLGQLNVSLDSFVTKSERVAEWLNLGEKHGVVVYEGALVESLHESFKSGELNGVELVSLEGSEFLLELKLDGSVKTAREDLAKSVGHSEQGVDVGGAVHFSEEALEVGGLVNIFAKILNLNNFACNELNALIRGLGHKLSGLLGSAAADLVHLANEGLALFAVISVRVNLCEALCHLVGKLFRLF